MLRMLVTGCTIASLMLAATSASHTPTFNKDVLPILQKQCQQCHRPGDIAPMPFLTYQDTRPWAKAIKSAVVTRKMPPWFADPRYGHFANARVLSEAEINTVAAWADNGSPEGDPKDKPAPANFADRFSIQPDIVVEFPRDVQIPANGNVDQGYLVVKANFPRDMWVSAAEVRAGNRKVVHHMKAWIRPPGSPWLADAPEGVFYVPQRGVFRPTAASAPPWSFDRPKPVQDILAKYNPGVNAQEFSLGGAAKFVAAGSDIVFECHYVTTGKPEIDRSRVGITLASAVPEKRYLTITGIENHNFAVPANTDNYEVKAQTVLQNQVELAWVQPHLHMRGKDWELRATYPSGESEVLMKAKFDWAWQLGFEFAKPILLPKGTRLESIAHFDNTANNPYNPDPNVEVRYGPRSTDEMQIGFMGFIVDAHADPDQLFPRGRPAAAQME